MKSKKNRFKVRLQSCCLLLLFGAALMAQNANAAAAATLYFSQTDVNTHVTALSATNGGSFNIVPTINTGVNQVTVVHLIINFDTSRLTLNNITVPASYSASDPFFNSETLGFDPQEKDGSGNPIGGLATIIADANSTGILSYDLSIGTSHSYVTGVFRVSSLNFTAKATGDASIGFSAASNAYANDLGGDAVVGRTGAIATINAPAAPTYTIGGTVSGLNGMLTLQDSLNTGLGSTQTTTNGTNTFFSGLNNDEAYSVVVTSQPSGQTCTINNGAGTVSGANVTNVSVSCVSNDTAAPVRSAGSPSGTLTAGTTSVNLSLNTNENATCKYSGAQNTAFGSMASAFMTTGSTTHSTQLTGLSSGVDYRYYVRCQDSFNNANTDDYLINFSIAAPAPAPAPAVTSSNKDDGGNKDKKKSSSPTRGISNSKTTVTKGAVLIQRGKKFSKNSFVLLYFSKVGGGYYPPTKVKTSGSGTFAISYRVNKPAGKYTWYAVDIKTNKRSKNATYRVK